MDQEGPSTAPGGHTDQVTDTRATVQPSGASVAVAPPAGAPRAVVTPPVETILRPERGAIDGGPVAVPSAPAAPFVYALGRIEVRFPSLGVEKEFLQARGRADTAGLTDRQVLHDVLSHRRNRYLAQQACWVLSVEGLETYLLQPRDPADFELLVEALRPAPRPTDVDVVIGIRGPVASPSMCNGMMLPVVTLQQIYSFDVDSFLRAIPRPEDTSEEDFGPAAEDLLYRIMQIADNAGATDEHRALNYLAVRYPAIYARAAEAVQGDASLTSVEVRPSRLSGARKIVDVIFSFTNRSSDVTEKSFVRVDVTEMFPFLVTKLSPFYDRAVALALG